MAYKLLVIAIAAAVLGAAAAMWILYLNHDLWILHQTGHGATALGVSAWT